MNLSHKEQRKQVYQIMQDFLRSTLVSEEELKLGDVFQGLGDKPPKTPCKLKIPARGRNAQEVYDEMLTDVYAQQSHLQHPRCFSFIPSPVSPYSWMGDIMTSVCDPHAGSWMLSSGACRIEQELIRWMSGLAGYPNTSGGIFVSGGSIANMTALTAARDAKLSPKDRERAVAYVSGQTHSSVAKSLRIIGFWPSQIRVIPTDADFCMDIPALRAAVEQDLADGKRPFAVIATAGTTNTGSIDPLPEIAALCKKHDMWMHVDGAYGASVLVSKKYRSRLKGIELSDSFSWDAHKWLMQTYGCSAVLVRDQATLLHSFSTHPEYLKDAEAKEGQVNFWDLGPELSRPARCLKLWITLQTLGTDAVGEMIEYGYQLAEWAQDELMRHTHWEIISPAQQAILNFRYAPDGMSEAQLDEINQELSRKITESGYAGLVTTELHGKKVLRICALHPETTEMDMRTTIRLLDQYAKSLYLQRTA